MHQALYLSRLPPLPFLCQPGFLFFLSRLSFFVPWLGLPPIELFLCVYLELYACDTRLFNQ